MREIWMQWGLIGLLATVASGCDCDEDCGGFDYRAPDAPHGVYSVTGDRQVEIFWLPCEASDLDGYIVYRGNSQRGHFDRLATLSARSTTYVDRDVNNGQTYWYAVSAVDESGNEGDLSREEVFDTPRPEGYSTRLSNSMIDPTRAGFDFSRREVVDARSEEADVYYWRSDVEGAWIIATERSETEMTDLQDAGFGPLRDVDWAPDHGWSPHGEAQLIEGHCYVVWTWDNHFAKFRVVSLAGDSLVLDWAYQTDPGNPELLVPTHPGAIGPVGSQSRAHAIGLAGR
ncbi:MAG: fibronectin type III domain-containing protein [Candidatus Eisenbacteria bacterium]